MSNRIFAEKINTISEEVRIFKRRALKDVKRIKSHKIPARINHSVKNQCNNLILDLAEKMRINLETVKKIFKI